MAYQEIIAPATPAAVIDAIRAFAEANGWTVSRNNLSGSNRTVTLKRAETDYLHIYNLNANNVYLRGSIDYASGATPDATTRRGHRAVLNVGAGPYTKLFMFADNTPSPYVHFVIEANTAGNFWHGSFGVMDKFEAFTGGLDYDGTSWTTPGTTNGAPWTYGSSSYPLFAGNYSTYTAPTTTTSPCGAIRCDFAADSRTDAWFSFSDDSNADTDLSIRCGIHASRGGGSTDGELTYKAESCDGNVFSNRSILHRIMASVRRVGGYWSPIGTFPDVRFCSVAKFTDGQEITIGSDVWKIFPMLRKGSVGAPLYERYSQNFGYAYRKKV